VFKDERIKIDNDQTLKWDWLLLTENNVENVKDSMIEEWVICKEMRHKDLKELGLIMTKLMKLKTSMLNSDFIILQQSEKWLKNISILEFLAATETLLLNDFRTVCLCFFTFVCIY